ncbi:MAG: ATP-binding cassette domain-containing protein [bacterium]|nr:ATP-binding cassette domain-containing protein [bacterium]
MTATSPGPAVDGGISADVRVTLGDFTLDVRLEVPAGGIVAVMGSNGSGKTTLLRCLAGLEPVEAGRVTLAGRVVDDPAEGIWVPPEQRGVGYAYQDVRLFGHLSAVENVAFGPRCRGAGRAEARRGASTALDAVGMTALARAKPARLSGGQSQRVGLARALAVEPEVLLLDEPFSATDTDVRPLLREQVRTAGASVVLVTHDPTDAEDLADQLLVLEAGRIAP